MSAARQEEAEQLERLQTNQLALGGQQLENGSNAVFDVERRHHRARVLGHQGDEHLQDIVQVLVLVHRRQVVEDALQLVLLHPVPDHNQLLEEQQDVRPNGQDVFLGGPRPIQPLGHDAALWPRIHNPVVELERVHGLQNGADASHIAVDLRVAEELGGQVGVETGLHIGRRVDPQGRVEEDMVQQLPRQKREAKQLSIRQVSNLSCYSHVWFFVFFYSRSFDKSKVPLIYFLSEFFSMACSKDHKIIRIQAQGINNNNNNNIGNR